MSEIYLGPLVLTKNKLIKEKIKRFGCEDCGTVTRHELDEYCSRCGSRYETYFVEEDRYDISRTLVSDSIKEAFHCTDLSYDNHQVWILNIMRGTPRYYHDTCDQCLTRKDIDQDKEIEHLTQVYAKELSIFREFYGEDNVRIDWGFCRYFL